MDIKEIRKAMEKYGVPGRDLYELPTSSLTFPDGANYRMEVSGVEHLSTLEALVDEMEERDIPIHRLISTVMGSTYLDDEELEDFAKLAKEKNMEVIITPGPRSGWDTGRQIATPEGALSGARTRGSDNLSYFIADIMRCAEMGFRGFLVMDEGALWLVSKLREDGLIPKDTVFKVSIYAGHGNAAGAKVLESLGADTFNPLGDLSLPMFASIRKAVKIPLDVHIILSESMGGFNRMWEGAELARLTSPCYFKIEPGTALAIGSGLYRPWTSEDLLANLVREKVKYAETIRNLIDQINPELTISKQGPKDLAVPK
ncbi:MAG: hypothetical protein U9N35_04735 [Euryarchaeota archaeon]|nr:hypothetical protein [Euryarchaeota archaeon]